MINPRNLLVYGAAAASIGYIFSIATGSIGLFLFIASWLLNFKDLNFKRLLKWNGLYLLTLFFLILTFGVFYSINMAQGQKDIVRHLPFLIYPAAIRQIGFWQRGGIFNWYYFYRYDFLEIFKQHPTYLSIFTLLSLSFLLFSKSQLLLTKRFLYFSIILQTVAIIFYGSRIGYIIFFLILLTHFFKNLKSRKDANRVRYVLIFCFGLVVLFFISFNIPIVKERLLYTLGYNYDYKFNNNEFIKDSSPEEKGRLLLWQDAIDLIKEKPILGYGTGSTRDVLLQKYKKEGHTLFLENRFNAHNSYLELLLSGGIFLLLSYLLLIIILFLNSFRKGNLVLLSFTAIILLTSITETLFIAQGIMFLGFFYCFLLTELNEK